MSEITNEVVRQAIEQQFEIVLNALHNDGLVTEMKAVKVYNEQVFKSLPNEALNKKTVFIVVRFGKGSINYSALSVPIELVVFGYPNSINQTQTLLLSFAETWTTLQLLDNSITGSLGEAPYPTSTQVWQTPNVFSNFNEVGDHFRSTFSLGGVLILGINTVKLSSLTYYPNGLADTASAEPIQYMEIHDSYRASVAPQPFGDTDGFTKSEIDFGTNTLSLALYLLDTQLVADILAVKGYVQKNSGSDWKTSTKSRNSDFIITIEFTNGFTNVGEDSLQYTWKIANCDISQPLGDITKMSVTFTH